MWEQTIRVDGERNGVATAGLGLWHYEFNHDSDKSIRYFDQAFKTDPDFMQKTGFLYINNLAEKGNLKSAANRLKWSAEWSRSVREQERIIKGYDEFTEMKPLIHHRLARVAYLIHDPTMRNAGEEYLKELEALRPNDIHVLYLRGQLSLLTGDLPGAEAAWERLKKNSQRKDCVRYRFFGNVVENAKLAVHDQGERSGNPK
jgi:tetratricopeptide (TPR) repeat protein